MTSTSTATTPRAGRLDRRVVDWAVADVPDLAGRRAVVTGASAGLGRALAGHLARAGADVVLVARDESRGAVVRDALVAAGVRGRVTVERADLADLGSVERLAERLLTDRVDLDVLVHNAGTGAAARRTTAQGHEVLLATHVLGPHLLSGRLRGALEQGSSPRVVTVGSGLHRLVRTRLDLDDLEGERRYSPARAYVQTKTAGMVVARELDRRLQAAGSPVRSVVAHPGVARTALQSSGTTLAERAVARVLAATMGRDVEQSVLPLLHAATADDVVRDRLLGPGGPRDRTVVTSERHVGALADPAVGAAAWDAVEDAVAG
ncbi:SDR family NAD(P)-dependent oxidoreductase [Cellulomonas fimi]|uniref:Short-chain dehydrogenase/reductase SDR n=1 Tax=Cellulomonas fimi (strain ATCC 484 / DSM 20113 / JCM 1341 / CCUG 24087 / LMG 16345 / NBRC 15513 / NCIMB 8980 / NCTC 7547 / NRS-133) TaxID=590998 RepID=F4H3L0_CELFA|nr:SDR family NAD(P)-dependent oxidoreductase [Cellulomonas fimi]AEE47676.1 short-chain dehydrogenase/reductase SDR [Cellulomonas fimi ATCC 484]NNH07431.1 SDR family NAD(P)-dependent oxidoreductase [Cellulomonas fimi]VEH36775.1 Fatty acyl-CoA reductase [Cellulomonas fimi]